MAFNKVILMGNLTADPELRTTPNGQNLASFTIAINRVWNSSNGERQEETSFINCTAWGRTGETISKYLKKDNLTHIYNGVNPKIYTPLSNEQKSEARKKLGFKNDYKIFIFSGRFIRRKRVPELVNFFNKKQFSNTQLLLLGEGIEETICKEKANNNPNIIFLGFSDNPEKNC